MDPISIALMATSAFGNIVGNSVAREKQVQKQKELAEFTNKINRENARSADAMRVESLRKAGLNPGLAYNGASEVSPPSLGNVQGTPPDLSAIAQIPSVSADVDLKESQTSLNKAEADKIELENEEKRGENKGIESYLKSLGITSDNIKPNQFTGFLTGIDRVDEYVPHSEERKNRKLAALIQKEFNEGIISDPEKHEEVNKALFTQYSNLLLDSEGKKLTNANLKQENENLKLTAFSIRSNTAKNYKEIEVMNEQINKFKKEIQKMNSEISKNFAEIGKMSKEMSQIDVNIEKLRSDIVVADESSMQFILTNYMNAVRSRDSEKIAYWNKILHFKMNDFDLPFGIGGIFKMVDTSSLQHNIK